MSQDHLLIDFPIRGPANAKALTEELLPLMPDLARAQDDVGTVHSPRFMVKGDEKLLFLSGMTLAALCSWLLAKLLLPADVEVAIIPTLGALAVRHFRHGKQEEHEPKHPAVKFLVAAWNEGDFSEAEKHVAPDCAVFMNGFSPDLGPNESGPALAEESIGYWRSIVPDIRMELSQEIRAKDQIAIEWVLTGTHTGERSDLPASGNAIEIQGSAFLMLDDDKIVEAWSVFDSLAFAVQTGTAEEPAWWPARREAS